MTADQASAAIIAAGFGPQLSTRPPHGVMRGEFVIMWPLITQEFNRALGLLRQAITDPVSGFTQAISRGEFEVTVWE